MASKPSQTATPPIIATKQRNWDDIICQNLADSLLSGTADPVEQARLLASRSEGSGDWLDTILIASIGLKMDNSSVRIAVGLRLGIHLVHPHQCCNGTMVTSDGHHGHSCKKSAGRQSRHSQINGIRTFLNADVLATRKATGLCTSAGMTGKRPGRNNNLPLGRKDDAWHGTQLVRKLLQFRTFKLQGSLLTLPRKLQRKRKLLNIPIYQRG